MILIGNRCFYVVIIQLGVRDLEVEFGNENVILDGIFSPNFLSTISDFFVDQKC